MKENVVFIICTIFIFLNINKLEASNIWVLDKELSYPSQHYN